MNFDSNNLEELTFVHELINWIRTTVWLEHPLVSLQDLKYHGEVDSRVRGHSISS